MKKIFTLLLVCLGLSSAAQPYSPGFLNWSESLTNGAGVSWDPCFYNAYGTDLSVDTSFTGTLWVSNVFSMLPYGSGVPVNNKVNLWSPAASEFQFELSAGGGFPYYAWLDTNGSTQLLIFFNPYPTFDFNNNSFDIVASSSGFSSFTNNGSGGIAGAVQIGGALTIQSNSVISGNGSGLTNLNASSFTGGTTALTNGQAAAATFNNTVTATGFNFSDGKTLMNINSTYLDFVLGNTAAAAEFGTTAGTDNGSILAGTLQGTGTPSFIDPTGNVPPATNIATLSGTQTFSGAKTMTNTGNAFTGTFTGNGSGLTNLTLTNGVNYYLPTNLLCFTTGSTKNTAFAQYYTNITPYFARVLFTVSAGSTGAASWAEYTFNTNSTFEQSFTNYCPNSYAEMNQLQTFTFEIAPGEYFACSNVVGTILSGSTNKVYLHFP